MSGNGAGMTTGCDWGPGPDTIVPNKLAENMCGSQGGRHENIVTGGEPTPHN